MPQRALLAGILLAGLALTACTADGSAPQRLDELPDSDVGVQLFQLPWTVVAEECEQTLGPAGYDWVLLSPAQEHIVGDPWWVSYQPVSYAIESRLGTREEFAEMTRRCADAGVDVIADAVINHMTGQDEPGIGWAGSAYEHYEYPGLYGYDDFHHCTLTGNSDIVDYRLREQVQSCELVNLADLDTASPAVRATIIAHLKDLLELGASGLRIDAAKHMAAEDVAAIVAGLPPGVRVISEVIRSAREPIQPEEYLDSGEVFEFQYARDLFPQLQSGLLDDPGLEGKRPMHVPAASAVVFIDNHDTERGEARVTYRDGARYLMANALMLADDYGSPVLHSGYAFSDRDAGPLVDGQGRVVAETCQADAGTAAALRTLLDGERSCLHALPGIAGLIELRRVADGSPRLPGERQGRAYGFEREGRAVIAVNTGVSPASFELAVSLPDGRYCDVVASGAIGRSGGEGGCAADAAVITVKDGVAVLQLDPGQTAATHLLARAGGD